MSLVVTQWNCISLSTRVIAGVSSTSCTSTSCTSALVVLRNIWASETDVDFLTKEKFHKTQVCVPHSGFLWSQSTKRHHSCPFPKIIIFLKLRVKWNDAREETKNAWRQVTIFSFAKSTSNYVEKRYHISTVAPMPVCHNYCTSYFPRMHYLPFLVRCWEQWSISCGIQCAMHFQKFHRQYGDLCGQTHCCVLLLRDSVLHNLFACHSDLTLGFLCCRSEVRWTPASKNWVIMVGHFRCWIGSKIVVGCVKKMSWQPTNLLWR